MDQLFEIRTMEQHWIDSIGMDYDLCSHGRLYLRAGDTVLSDENEDDWGISESALALLRTVKYGHPHMVPALTGLDEGYRFRGGDDTLIYHGCGLILMTGCNIRIRWDVIHRDGNVLLKNFVNCPTANPEETRRYNGLEISMPLSDYAREVHQFATEARKFFEGVEKQFTRSQQWEGEYQAFWDDFDHLLDYAAGKSGLMHV